MTTTSITSGSDFIGKTLIIGSTASAARSWSRVLDFNNNSLSLEAGAGEEAQATEAIEILLTGEPISIAFNPVFLADGLTAVGTKFVQISFTGANKPAILMGKSDKDGTLVENYRYLLMPMRYAS